MDLPVVGLQNVSTQLIIFWRWRWLSGRISRPDVLNQVATNRIDLPVIHGARVNLPLDESDDQQPLFPSCDMRGQRELKGTKL